LPSISFCEEGMTQIVAVAVLLLVAVEGEAEGQTLTATTTTFMHCYMQASPVPWM
jgi:hypothetical protein